MTLRPSENVFPKQAFRRSVQDFPNQGEISTTLATTNPLTFQIAGISDTIPPWGRATVKTRDRELRKFWQTETMLAGAINAVCTRNSAFEWEVEGPENTAEAITQMLHMAMVGNERGWVNFIQSVSQDLYTTDNGAFIEIVRAENKPDSPVIGIAHLDSGQCTRTGNPDFPVLYEDRKGRIHKMPWYAIIPMAELPSPIERMNGVGFCSVSRVLRMAQLLYNIATYKNEKVSGRFYKAIHFVGGVSRREIEDIMDRGQEQADNRGQTRYILPQIVASLDPEKPVSTATIDLAALPDNFNLDEELKWYISGLALGFGVDYQDFAPLPGGNLGTSTQSEVLHRKSRGKGPAVFMETLQNVFHFYGVLPKNVRFKFHERDLASEVEAAQIKKERAQEIAVLLRAGVLTPEAARKKMVRDGYLEPEDVAAIAPEYGEELLLRPRGTSFGNTGRDTVGNEVSRVEQ